MKNPYTILFDIPPLIKKSTRPPWSNIRLSTAEQVSYLNFKNTELSSQVARFRSFYLQLMEFNNKTEFEFKCKVHAPQHFLFFQNKGNTSFFTSEGFFHSHAKTGHFALTYFNAGIHHVRLKAGLHTALLIAPRPKWLARSTQDLPLLKSYLKTLEQKKHYHPPMPPYYFMTEHLRKMQEEIYSKLANGIGYKNGFLKMQVSRILEKYDILAAKKKNKLPYQIIEYIHQQHTDPGLSPQSIAYHFQKTERSLRDQFKTEFSITIHDYLTHLRVRSALHLMKQNNSGPLDVYLEVGYNEVNTLRYHLGKFGL